MTSATGVDSILSQIRAMRQQSVATTPVQPPLLPGAAEGSPAVSPAGFGDLLKQSVNAVNSAQQTAAGQASAYERGDSISLTQVMVSLQKADVSFKAAVEVRNKMIDAYHEVMRMSV